MNADRKQTLGEFLKSERERRGLTIEQTSSATKIGLKILKHLEADQYSELPALPFVRGFIRNYGKFLGLDGDKLLKEYATFLDEHANERPKRDAGHSGYAFERPEGEQSRKILWGVMAGMLVFGGAVVFLFKPSLKRKHHSHVDKMKVGGGGETDDDGNPIPAESASPTPLVSGQPSPLPSGVVPSGVPSPAVSPVAPASPTPLPKPSPEAPFIAPKLPLVLAPSPVPSPTPSPKAAPSPAATSTPVPVPSGAPTPVSLEDSLKVDPLQSGKDLTAKEVHYKLVLRTRADVWVRYRSDAKKLTRFALKKDKILVLRAKERLYLQVSNPDSITIQASGKPEVLFSQAPNLIQYHGSPTVAYPPQPPETMEENFKAGTALPFTDGPPAF